jgi:DNA modification methylase
VLTWKFTYLLGNDNRNVYKPDCKYILFYRGVNAPELKHLYSDEWTSVHVMDADGGSLADPDYELRFPIKLAARFIQHSTSDGQTVYDPFARYGTILLAAKKLGRGAIGYESDAKMAEKAYERGIERA